MLDAAPPQAKRYVSDAGWSIRTTPFRDSSAGVTKTPMLILLGAVGAVLLIACSNIAGLMLARTSARARELAVRASLGATRVRLIRSVAAESLLLSLTGGAVGVAIAQAAARLLLRLAPESAAAGLEPRLDAYVLGFAVAASVISGILFGLVPAWQLAKLNPHPGCSGGGRTFAGGTQQRLRSVLVVAEAALALVLLVAAGLFLRSLARLQAINPGFDPRGVHDGILRPAQRKRMRTPNGRQSSSGTCWRGWHRRTALRQPPSAGRFPSAASLRPAPSSLLAGPFPRESLFHNRSAGG